jgi:hypothetical protein
MLVLAGAAPGTNYSKFHTYLEALHWFSIYWSSSIRMLTFAEYNFIRAEAALGSLLQVMHKRFSSGCRASMESAGVAAADVQLI